MIFPNPSGCAFQGVSPQTMDLQATIIQHKARSISLCQFGTNCFKWIINGVHSSQTPAAWPNAGNSVLTITQRANTWSMGRKMRQQIADDTAPRRYTGQKQIVGDFIYCFVESARAELQPTAGFFVGFLVGYMETMTRKMRMCIV